MSERPRETVSETFKNWVTVTAFILAGVWTYFTFTHDRIVSPRSAPVNVTTELEVRAAGELTDGENGRLTVIELKMTATNAGPRIVFLLPSYWLAHGINVSAIDEANWTEAVSHNLETRVEVQRGRYYATSAPSLIAASVAFPDEFLQPGETVSRSTLIYVPTGRFDAVQVKVIIPSVHQTAVLDVDYTVTATGGLRREIYELGEGGARTKIEDGTYLYRRHGLQWAASERQLGLPRTSQLSTLPSQPASPAD